MHFGKNNTDARDRLLWDESCQKALGRFTYHFRAAIG